MDQTNDKTTLSSYDRAIGILKDLPDVVASKPTTVPVVPTFGVGTHTYIVQTIRRREEGDYVFFQDVSDGSTVRLVIPPRIADVIARQRDQLNFKSRSRAGKRRAEDMKAQGIQPGFMKKK